VHINVLSAASGILQARVRISFHVQAFTIDQEIKDFLTDHLVRIKKLFNFSSVKSVIRSYLCLLKTARKQISNKDGNYLISKVSISCSRTGLLFNLLK
jgi:hypothetical protein